MPITDMTFFTISGGQGEPAMMPTPQKQKNSIGNVNKHYTTEGKVRFRQTYVHIYIHKKQHKQKAHITANEHSAVMCPKSSI